MANIVLADDEEHLREMVAFKLRAAGHHVVPARDGAEALARACEENPDLIILDLMMPALDGLEVLRRLKADPRLQAVPVIVLSARGRERDMLTGLHGGAVEYVVKPCRLKDLAARVEAVLRARDPDDPLTVE